MSEPSGVRGGIEIVSAVLMAAATVGSAWCAYQASLWSGDETRSLAAANVAHFKALRKVSAANLDQVIDVSTFLSYTQNQASGQPRMAEFIRTHARKEFQPVLNAWIAEQRPGVEPADLPFKPPRYGVAHMREADQLEEEAAADTAAANAANAHGDLFVFHTVTFALALFFLGTTSDAHIRSWSLRRWMLLLGALVFTVNVISMARIPRSSSQAIGKYPTGAPLTPGE